MATNLISYFVPIDPNYVSKDPNGNWGQELHCQRHESAHDHHSHRGSCWADSKAACRFCAQSAQFNTGTKSLRKCTRPSAPQLISVIHKESCTSQLRNNRSNLAASSISDCTTQAVCTVSNLTANWRLPAIARLWTGTKYKTQQLCLSHNGNF